MIRFTPSLSASILAVAAVAAVIAPAHAQTPEVPAYRTFKDWVIGCDNSRSCTALGLQPDDSGRGAFIKVGRAGGGSSPVAIRLVLLDDELRPGDPVTLVIDGRPVAGLAPNRPIEDREDGFAMVTLRDSEITAFIDALRRGRRLTLAEAEPAAGDGDAVSLDGAMAALLFMDDVQGRVDTVTALVRAGPEPATAVPAPPSPPVVRPKPVPEGAHADPDLARIVRQRFTTEQPDACDPQDPGFADADAVQPLGNDTVLVSLLCWRGAYNFTSTYLLVDGGNADEARLVNFPSPLPGDGRDPLADANLTNGFFDPQTGQLSFFAKGRGIGDCGTSGEYAWTGERFVLVNFRVMDDCRLVPMTSWPVLWRADVR